MASTTTESSLSNNNTNERQQEIETAVAFLSISGPCKSRGDIYLACVATAGLGMCRHLRASFEQCARNNPSSIAYLKEIGNRMCSEVQEENNERMLCAARIVNQQYMPPHPPQQQQR